MFLPLSKDSAIIVHEALTRLHNKVSAEMDKIKDIDPVMDQALSALKEKRSAIDGVLSTLYSERMADAVEREEADIIQRGV